MMKRSTSVHIGNKFVSMVIEKANDVCRIEEIIYKNVNTTTDIGQFNFFITLK